MCSAICSVAQSCPPLYNCLPVSSACRIFQARILECGAISSYRESFYPSHQILVSCVSCIAGRFFICLAIGEVYNENRATLVARMLNCLPAMWETWVRPLGWEDPLEKEMATHSSIIAWRIPWTDEPGGL